MSENIDLVQTVLRIVGDHLGIPGAALSPDSHIASDLGADSLDRLELLMTVEESFRIKIPADEIPGIERIRDIADAIHRCQLPHASGPESTASTKTRKGVPSE